MGGGFQRLSLAGSETSHEGKGRSPHRSSLFSPCDAGWGGVNSWEDTQTPAKWLLYEKQALWVGGSAVSLGASAPVCSRY